MYLLLMIITYEVTENMANTLQEFADMKYGGDLQKTITKLIASGFTFRGYTGGVNKGKSNLNILSHADHQEYLTKAIKMD